jgi:enoyl-CoA hydratase/carnithine racemase
MFAQLRDRSDVRCVVLTGTGNAFCAGGDVKGMGPDATPRPDRPATREGIVAELTERQRTLTGALRALPQPTIAALPGAAAGAGFSIALACDLRIAAESAFVTTGFANIGLAGDYGASWLLPRLVGDAKARELFFGAERIDAQTCLALGLVNRVVPDAQLAQATRVWAQ